MAGARSKRATATLASLTIAGMLGLTAASVPLYRLFCQVTGYGGTTQVADDGTDAVLEQTIEVRFNADVDPDLAWSFQPAQRAVELRIGEERLAFYRAENHSERPVVGTATFNVTPHKAGPYFAKLACFCFEQQVLQPGEAVDMPVSFYVDPAILEDRATADLKTITLSYTFFRDDQATRALERSDAANGPSS